MARIKGHNLTKEFIPTTKLVSCTSDPIGTLFSVWHGSRYEDEVDAHMINKLYNEVSDVMYDPLYQYLMEYLIRCYPEYVNEDDDICKNTNRIIREVVKLVIKCDVPASEFVSLEFSTSDGSVAWREQMVRNRRIHPWVQTSRTADMEHYDCNRLSSIKRFGGDEAVKIYDNAVQTIRDAYTQLIALGVPSEDIRLQTQGHIHRSLWGIDLRNLLKLIGKRSSWIAQSSLWGPINADIISILRNLFGSSIIDDFVGINTDCEIQDNKVIQYKYDNEVMDRYTQKDPQPCDPLWLSYHKLCLPEHTDLEFYDYMKNMYIKMWNDNTLKVLGWNREDPSVIGPYDRPYSWFKLNNRLDDIKDLSSNLELKNN